MRSKADFDTVRFGGDLSITGCRCFADYAMPDLDEDVVCLFLPCGSVERFVLGSFFTGEVDPPASSQDIRMTRFKDGTTIAHDRDAHTYEIENTHIHADRWQVTVNTTDAVIVQTKDATVNASGSASITAGGNLSLKDGGTLSMTASSIVASQG